MEERRKAGTLAKGTNGQLRGKRKATGKGRGKAKAISGGAADTPPEMASLAELGSDKHLAKRARAVCGGWCSH
jgi:hypothetical protein